MSDDFASNPMPDSAPTPPAEPPPCIHPKLLKKGIVLLLEGETDIYELVMRYPEHGIVEISSNNPVLRTAAVGQFMHSIRWSHPGTKLNTIQQGWVMVFRFSNGEFHSQPIASARVSGVREDGTRWSYDVF